MSDQHPAPGAPPTTGTPSPGTSTSGYPTSGYPTPGYPTPARRAPLPRAAWALGAGGLALGLVVGGCSGVVGGALVASTGGPLVGGLLSAAGERSVADALPDELPRLRAFVAEERGLDWEQEVPVRALDDRAFEAALSGDGAGGEASSDGGGAEDEWPVGLDDPADGRAETYAALGLTPSAATYREAWESGDSAVVGFYDSDTREVVLRGTGWTPVVEETLVHELVHALDDQHVDLDAPLEEDPSPEEVTAHAAVVEGDAERVAWAWFDGLDDEQLDAYDEAWEQSWDEEDGRGAADVAFDPLADALVQFPYEYGYVAVEAVDGDRGPAAVTALLEDPLTTTEQVLAARPEPSSSPGLAAAADVVAPAAPEGAQVLGTGGLGLFPLSLLPLVDEAEDEGYWLEDDVVTFAWAGDAWTTWVDPQDEDRACTTVLVRLDDARGRDDLADDLQDWVASAGDVGASLAPVGETDLELHGCGDR